MTGTTPRLNGRVIRTRQGRLSLRLDRRTGVVSMILGLAVTGVGIAFLTTGDYVISIVDVARTIVGSGPPGADFIVNTLRLPRLLTGLLVGAALGVSGAVFQRLTGNPLGSPDVIGLMTGSATGAVLVIVLAHGTTYQIAGGALAGGLATALVVYALAMRPGTRGLRLILMGVGVGAMLLSVNYYLITRASLQDAMAAQVWLIGSLNGRTWAHVWAVGIALLALLPICAIRARQLAVMEMGDDIAVGLGVRVERVRLILVISAVALAAVATAASGPIGFVALAAPQLARRLTHSAGPGVLPAALMGALLLTVSDLATQRLITSVQLPVGLTTAAIGGLYLAGLLTSRRRQGRS